MLVRTLIWLCAFWPPIWIATNAAAAESSDCGDRPEACGRREFEAGIDDYRAGHYAAALEHFTASHHFKPHPAVLFNLALAEAKLGRGLEAIAHFEQVVNDPTSSAKLVEKARSELAQAESSLAVVELEAGVEAEVRIDGRRISGRPARERLDPGRHRIIVLTHGKQTMNREIELRAGERFLISLEAGRELTLQKPTEAPPKRPHAAVRGPSPWWFYAGAGVTAVLGGVTTWSALDTQHAYDQYTRDLPRLDQRQADERVEDGHARELRTNLLIGATAVAAAGTLALGVFVVDWGSSERSLSVQVAPDGVRASGRF